MFPVFQKGRCVRPDCKSFSNEFCRNDRFALSDYCKDMAKMEFVEMVDSKKRNILLGSKNNDSLAPKDIIVKSYRWKAKKCDTTY